MEIRLLASGDTHALNRVADGLFRRPIELRSVETFLADPRHHMAVAIADGTVIGFASAVRYVHPDEADALWVNDVAVAEPYRRRGAAKQLLDAMFAHAKSIGCRGAWVGTMVDNDAAHALYAAVGGRRVMPNYVMYEWHFDDARRCDPV